MCVAIPGKVIKTYKGSAIVDFEGVNMEVNTDLIESVDIGDYLLVHIGCAIEKINKIDAEEYKDTLKLVYNIGDKDVFK